MDPPIVLSHKTAWLYHNVARPSEPLSRASSLYDEDSLANEAEPTASLPKLGLDAKGLRASAAVGIVTDYLVALGISGSWDRCRLSGFAWYSTRRARSYRHARQLRF